jgi:hypothetical protein
MGARMRFSKSIMLVPLLLCGCAGTDAVAPYEAVTPVRFDVHDQVWRIFDRPAEGRMLVTPTIGDTIDETLLGGLTIGMADTESPRADYQAAAEAWLKHSGRRCKITDGKEVDSPRWEFTYKCR